jgi:hypothetical protein
MKATIIHDEHGRIISISKIGDLKEAGSKFVKVGLVPGKGQRLIEIELNRELDRKTLLDLHKEFRIDVANSKLVKKD